MPCRIVYEFGGKLQVSSLKLAFAAEVEPVNPQYEACEWKPVGKATNGPLLRKKFCSFTAEPEAPAAVAIKKSSIGAGAFGWAVNEWKTNGR
jgi:hypothetical protein